MTSPAANSDSNQRPSRLWWLVIALSAAIVALVVALVLNRPSDSDSVAQPDSQSTANTDEGESESTIDVARREEGDVTAMGDVDAPVVMVEYADYRCPFCGIFARDTMPELVEDYVETGQVRYEWRDMAMYGEQSVQAAVAARAAGEQGKFWEFHSAIFAAAPERGHLEIDRDKILTFADEAGVSDMAKFTEDLDSDELREQVQQDMNESQSIGVTSTPTFLIGDTPILGAQPPEVFRDAIESELEEG